MTDKQFAFELTIKPDDEQVLRKANTAYIDDLNAVANGDMDSIDDAGWRSYSFYSKDVGDFNYHKLVGAGLLDENNIQFPSRYRIKQLGRDTLAALGKAKAEFAQPYTPELVKQIEVARHERTLADAEAEIVKLRKELQDVETERDIRGDILNKLVGIRADLINKDSNSWIDSVQQIREELEVGREIADQLVQARKELKVVERLLDDRNRLLAAIPECELHGQCVPHALEWIEDSKSIRADYEELKGKYKEVLPRLSEKAAVSSMIARGQAGKVEDHKKILRSIVFISKPENRISTAKSFSNLTEALNETLDRVQNLAKVGIDIPSIGPVNGKTGFVTTVPRVGMAVLTPDGEGWIDEIDGEKIAVSGNWYTCDQLTVTDVSPKAKAEPHDPWKNNPKARPMPHPGTQTLDNF